ncbi:MAG: fibronectin type III domain-containing protein [Bryobacteraceae bacterium]
MLREAGVEFRFEVSDDGATAIAEVSPRGPLELKKLESQLKTDARAKVFRPSKDKQTDVQDEIRKIKKDFDIELFGKGCLVARTGGSMGKQPYVLQKTFTVGRYRQEGGHSMQSRNAFRATEMNVPAHRSTAVTATMVALILGAAVPASWAQAPAGEKVVPLKDARIKIELNSTDSDAGIQVFIDAEPWNSMEIFDPSGRKIFTATTRGSLTKQGGTELFLESGEPNFSEVPLDEFLQRFPEGNYRIVGEGIKGEKLVGTAKFTHILAAGPLLLSPMENALVNPTNLVVMWQPVAAPNGSSIIGYQVLVVKPDSGLPALPKIILDIMMPPTASSMAVPPGFLLPKSDYEWEVLAIEQGGNQTISVGHFRTP